MRHCNQNDVFGSDVADDDNCAARFKAQRKDRLSQSWWAWYWSALLIWRLNSRLLLVAKTEERTIRVGVENSEGFVMGVSSCSLNGDLQQITCLIVVEAKNVRNPKSDWNAALGIQGTSSYTCHSSLQQNRSCLHFGIESTACATNELRVINKKNAGYKVAGTNGLKHIATKTLNPGCAGAQTIHDEIRFCSLIVPEWVETPPIEMRHILFSSAYRYR